MFSSGIRSSGCRIAESPIRRFTSPSQPIRRFRHDHFPPSTGRRVRRVLRVADRADRESAGEMGEVDAGGDDFLHSSPVRGELRSGLLVDSQNSPGISRRAASRNKCRISFESLLANRMGGRPLSKSATDARRVFACPWQKDSSAPAHQWKRQRRNDPLASVAMTEGIWRRLKS